MMRIWLGIGLLAGSWLLGLSYFAPARPAMWFCVVAAALVLLSRVPLCWPQRRPLLAGTGLAGLAAFLMPWPYAAVPALLAAGMGLQVLELPRAWPRRLGNAAAVASGVMLVQAIALYAYMLLTARVHELPGVLVHLLAAIARLMGSDAAASGAAIVLRDGAAQQRIAATWELLFDPASVLFLAGGFSVLALFAAGPPRIAWAARGPGRAAVRLLLVFLAWVPLRVALLIGLLAHRTLRADYVTAPNVGDLLVNSYVHVLLLAGLVAMAARLVRGRVAAAAVQAGPPVAADGGWAVARPALLASGGVALLVFLTAWDPVGQAQAGRVMVVERHSTWEPTTEAYGTEVYGEAGSYNYAAVFAYAGQFFDMSRLLESEAISDETLSACEVLIIKTPTAPYAPAEVQAVERFVRRGGALLLIGDHTNVFNMNTHLNDVARQFGFTFRHDLLFCVGSPYTQRHVPPWPAHPLLQRVPPMNFAVSCSIDPGRSAGRMVVRNTGLWSLPPAYQEMNYHPQAEYRSDLQAGAWCQLWATHHGNGRVLGFADSTLFSNFCTFQPGKAELFVGMLQWLNHRSRWDEPWLRWLVLGLGAAVGGGLLAAGLLRLRGVPVGWTLTAAAALAAGALAGHAAAAINRASLPWPAAIRPLPHVVLDRQVSEVPLFTGAFADDRQGLGYGMFEQWIPRLGNYISRREGSEVFLGDALVVVCPTRSVSDEYREGLERYVAAGGHLLVVDSPDVEGSTANSLLEPFGLASYRAAAGQEGQLRVAGCEVQLPCAAACPISGGEALAWLNELPVAASVQYQRGRVTAWGFGALFNDAAMGFHWLPDPDAATLERYSVLYALLQSALPVQRQPSASGSPLTLHPPRPHVANF